MFKPSTFATDCEKAGFTPYEAMCFYDEVRRFCFHEIRGNGPKQPVAEMWGFVRSFAAQELEKVKSPADFIDYRKAWKKISITDLSKDKERFEFLIKEYPMDGLIDRCSGMFSMGKPPADRKDLWNAWGERGMSWSDLKRTIESDRPVLSDSSVPVGLTKEKARDYLLGVLNACGVNRFSWPYALGDGEEVFWKMAEDIRCCAQELSEQTGWGPDALGLGNRVSIFFGLSYDGFSGEFKSEGGGYGTIYTSSEVGWGAVAHEWMHALDFAINYKPIEGLSEKTSHEVKLHWSETVHNIGLVTWEERERWAVSNSVRKIVLERWREDPAVYELVKKSINEEGFHRGDFFKSFQVLYKQMNPDVLDYRLQLYAANAMAEIEVARENAGVPVSLWTSFAKYFEEIVNQHMPGLSREWAGYFLETRERVAHSFEATFGSGSLVSDVIVDESFRYPTSFETAGHRQQWKSFFQRSLSWKKEAIPNNRWSSDLKLNLKERRQASLSEASIPSAGLPHVKAR